MKKITLGDIVSPHVITVKLDTSVSELLATMEEKCISCVVAVDAAHRPLGIFTEQDAIRLMAELRPIAGLCMAEVMSAHPFSAPSDMDFRDAYHLIETKGYRHILVTQASGELMGVASEADFMHHMGIGYLVELKTVATAMTSVVYSLDTAKTLDDATKLMAQHKVSCVVIAEKNMPLGILTERDIVALARNVTDPAQVPITQVMKSPVQTVAVDFPLQEAIKLMDRSKMRRLVVVKAGEIAGLITRHDIVKSIQGRYVEFLQEALERQHRDLLSTQQQIQAVRQQLLAHSLMEQTLDAVLVIQPETGAILECNPAASTLLGYAHDELLDMTVSDIDANFTAPSDWHAERDMTVRDGKRLTETLHRHRDGGLIPVEIRAQVVARDEQRYIVAMVRDLSAYKNTQAQLRVQDVALNSTANAMVITNVEGVIEWANPAFTEMTGYALHEALGKRPRDLVRSGLQPREFYEALWNTILSGQVWRGELINKRKDGAHYVEEMTITPVYAEGKVITHFIAVTQDISVRKATENQLVQSEITYRGILDQVTEAVYVVDETGRIVYANQGTETMYGYSHEEMLQQQNGWTLLATEKNDLAELQLKLQKLFAGEPQYIEFWGVRKNGEIFPKSANGVRGEYFGCTVAIIVARDISEQKATETELVASERRYRNLIENAPFAIVIVDEVSESLVFGNHPAELMFEIEFAEAKGAKAENFYVRSSDRERIVTRQLAGDVVTEEIEMRTAQGRHLWVQITSANILFEGKSAHIASLLDVTARRAANDELRANRAMLQQLIDTAPLSIFWKDLDFIYLGCNAMFAKLANLAEPAQIIGKSDFDLPWGKAEAEAYRADDRIVMEQDCHKTNIIETQLQVDGSRIWVNTSKVPLKNQSGQVFGVLGTSLDITAQKNTEEKLHTREVQLTSIIENQPGLLWLKDTQSRLLMANSKFAEACEQPLHEIIGKTDRELWPDALAEKYRADDIAVMQTGKPLVTQEQVMEQGEPRWFETFKLPVRDAAGKVIGTTGFTHNISERIAAEAQLREAAAVMANTHEGVVITDTTPHILAINAAYTRITGYNEVEALGKNPNIVSSGRQTPDFYAAMWQQLGAQGYWQGEVWNRRKSGEVYPQLLTISTIYDEQHQPIRYVGVFADISELKENQAKLEYVAHHDPLTQLPNRALVESRLAQELEQAHRHRQQLAVLFIDLDRFKAVNDSYGHLVGDELLCAVAARLNMRLREGDTLGRLGGDEFILLVTNVKIPHDAAVVARDFINALSEAFVLSNGTEVFIGGSIGISLFPHDGATGTDLMRNADAAMYLAKESGRNQFSFYTSALNADAQSKLVLENALRHAIFERRLVLYYQPQVDLHTGRICAAEALIRWQKEDGTLVPPAEFIPLAERSGLILSIGNWVIEQTCMQLRLWLDEGLSEVVVAINVSARQFRNGNLHKLIAQALKKFKVPAHHLEVEITESMLMHDPEAAVITLQALKELGIKLSLDDFGTGYSNFGYLSRFPIDMLKIDQSFVQKVVTDNNAIEITSAIIGLAHRMNLGVVAEGVETEAQLAFLRANDCDELQGYYFSKPLPAREFSALLRSGKSLASENHEAQTKRTLLIVEEDDDTLREIKASLRSDYYHLLTATRPAAALEMMTLHAVQVVLVDHHAPLIDALSLLQTIQQLHPRCVRILLATQRNDMAKFNAAVNEGIADKLLTKPITDELLRKHMRAAFAYQESIVNEQKN